MRRGSYVKNAAILTAASLVLRLAGMWFRIYLANALGEQGVGLYALVQATAAEAATLPTSLTTERQGMAVRAGLAALTAEIKLRRCASPDAPAEGECARMIAEAIEGFREANRLLPQIEDMIERDNGEMLQLVKTGVQRAEDALVASARKTAGGKR